MGNRNTVATPHAEYRPLGTNDLRFPPTRPELAQWSAEPNNKRDLGDLLFILDLWEIVFDYAAVWFPMIVPEQQRRRLPTDLELWTRPMPLPSPRTEDQRSWFQTILRNGAYVGDLHHGVVLVFSDYDERHKQRHFFHVRIVPSENCLEWQYLLSNPVSEDWTCVYIGDTDMVFQSRRTEDDPQKRHKSVLQFHRLEWYAHADGWITVRSIRVPMMDMTVPVSTFRRSVAIVADGPGPNRWVMAYSWRSASDDKIVMVGVVRLPGAHITYVPPASAPAEFVVGASVATLATLHRHEEHGEDTLEVVLQTFPESDVVVVARYGLPSHSIWLSSACMVLATHRSMDRPYIVTPQNLLLYLPGSSVRTPFALAPSDNEYNHNRILVFPLADLRWDNARVLWESYSVQLQRMELARDGTLCLFGYQREGTHKRYLERIPMQLAASTAVIPNVKSAQKESSPSIEMAAAAAAATSGAHPKRPLSSGKFTCRVDLVDPEAEDRTRHPHYTLIAELPRPWHTGGGGGTPHLVHRGQLGIAAPWTLQLPSRIPAITRMTFRLLRQRTTDDHTNAEYEAAGGHVTVRELNTDTTTTKTISIALSDRDGRPQGTVVLVPQFTRPPFDLRGNNSAVVVSEQPQQPSFDSGSRDEDLFGGVPPWGNTIRALRRTHIRYENDNKSTPVWAIVMLTDPSPRAAVTDRFLQHALECVTRWSGFRDAADWAAQADRGAAGTCDVLAQVLGWFPWSCVYLSDLTWDTRRRSFILFDQFTTLREKEDFSKAGGDCEDVSCEVLRIFESITARDPTTYSVGSPLRVLIERLQCYCAFVVDTSIYNGDGRLTTTPDKDPLSGMSSIGSSYEPKAAPTGVQLHMYVQLLPWHTVVALIGAADPTLASALKQTLTDRRDGALERSTYCPALSVEGTEPCRSDWSRARNDPAAVAIDRYNDTSASAIRRWLEARKAQKTYAKIRTAVTVSQYLRDQFYRACICMYSPQLFKLLGARHSWIPCLVSPLRAGVPTEDWMAALSTVPATSKLYAPYALAPLPAASANDQKALRSLLSRAPLTHPLDLNLAAASCDFDCNAMTTMMTSKTSARPVVYLTARAIDWTSTDRKLFRDAVEEDGQYTIVSDGITVPITSTNAIVVYRLLRTNDMASTTTITGPKRTKPSLGRDEKDESERPTYKLAYTDTSGTAASAGSGGSLVQRPFSETGTMNAQGGSGSAGSGLPALQRLPSLDRGTVPAAELDRKARAMIQQTIGGPRESRFPNVLSSLITSYGRASIRYVPEDIIKFISQTNFNIVGLDEYPSQPKRSDRYRIHGIPLLYGLESSVLSLLALNDDNLRVRTVTSMNSTPDAFAWKAQDGLTMTYKGPTAVTSLVFHPGRRSRLGVLPADDPEALALRSKAPPASAAAGFPVGEWMEMNVSCSPDQTPLLPERLRYRPASASPLPCLESRPGAPVGLDTSDSGRFLFFRTEQSQAQGNIICIAVVDMQTRVQQTLILELQVETMGTAEWGFRVVAVARSPNEVVSALAILEKKNRVRANAFHWGTFRLCRILGTHDMMIKHGVSLVRLKYEASSEVWSTEGSPNINPSGLLPHNVIFFDTAIGSLRNDGSAMTVYPYPDVGQSTTAWEEGDADIIRWEESKIGVGTRGTLERLAYWSLDRGRVAIAMVHTYLDPTNNQAPCPGGSLADDSPSLNRRPDFTVSRREHSWFVYRIVILTPDLNATVSAPKRRTRTADTTSAVDKQQRRLATDVKSQPVRVAEPLRQALRPILPPELVDIISDATGSKTQLGMTFQGWIRGSRASGPSQFTSTCKIIAVSAGGYMYGQYSYDDDRFQCYFKARMVNRRFQIVARTDHVDGMLGAEWVRVDLERDRIVALSDTQDDGELLRIYQFHGTDPIVRVVRERTIPHGTVATRRAITEAMEMVPSSDGSLGASYVLMGQRTSTLRVYDLWSQTNDRSPLPLPVSLDNKTVIDRCTPIRGTDGFVLTTLVPGGITTFRMWIRQSDGKWRGSDPRPLVVVPSTETTPTPRYEIKVWFQDSVVVSCHAFTGADYGCSIGTFSDDGIVVDVDHPTRPFIGRPNIVPVVGGDDGTVAFMSEWIGQGDGKDITDPILAWPSAFVTRTGAPVDASDDVDGVWDDMSDDVGLAFQPGRTLTDDQHARVLEIFKAHGTENAHPTVRDARTTFNRGVPMILYMFDRTGGPTVASKPKHAVSASSSTAAAAGVPRT